MGRGFGVLRVLLGLATLSTASGGAATVGAQQARPTGLTAVDGIKVGHHTLTGRPTGCTVVLAEAGVTAGVDVRGAAPGTRDTDLLHPANLVDQVHAVFLSGGSAFGLETAGGVMRYLESRKIGFRFGGAHVPIVPGAVIFDLPVGGKPEIRPDADCGFKAAQAATSGPIAEGSVGAGAGATVGKFAGVNRPMKGGIGTASIALPGGLIVAALVAVNPAGDIVDPSTGRIVAGARTEDGKGLLDVRTILRSGVLDKPRPGENTTLAVIATNARLSKAHASRIAMSAHDGFARTIVPAHTMVDGDTIFTLATGTYSAEVNLSLVGALAAEAVADAVLRAVREATGLPGYPAIRDLNK